MLLINVLVVKHIPLLPPRDMGELTLTGVKTEKIPHPIHVGTLFVNLRVRYDDITVHIPDVCCQTLSKPPPHGAT